MSAQIVLLWLPPFITLIGRFVSDYSLHVPLRRYDKKDAPCIFHQGIQCPTKIHFLTY